MVDSAIDKIKQLPGDSFEEKHDEALKKKEKLDKNKDRIVVPLDFNPHMAKASDVLSKHYRGMIRKNETLLEEIKCCDFSGKFNNLPERRKYHMCRSYCSHLKEDVFQTLGDFCQIIHLSLELS